MPNSIIYLLVIGAACGHAAWNAIGFAVPDKYAGLLVMNAVLGLCGVAMYADAPGLHHSVIPYLLASIALHCGYQIALLKAYNLGGFLRIYPISRGMVPLVVTAASLVIGEVHPSSLGIVGLALVCTGLVCAAVPPDQQHRATDRKAVTAAVAVGILVAGYTLADGLTVNVAHNILGSLGLIYLAQASIFSAVVLTMRVPATADIKRVLWPGIAGGLISAAVFGAVFWAQSRIPTFIVSTLRETSIVFGFIFGVVFFQEKCTRLRSVSVVAVLAGGTLLDLAMSWSGGR